MRPPTHDDPNAIPRNGTEVPWADIPHPPADDAGSRAAPPAPEVYEDPPDGSAPSGAAAQRGT